MWSEYDRVPRIIRIARTFTNNNRGEAKAETRIDVLVDHVAIVSLSTSVFRLTTSRVRTMRNYLSALVQELYLNIYFGYRICSILRDYII